MGQRLDRGGVHRAGEHFQKVCCVSCHVIYPIFGMSRPLEFNVCFFLIEAMCSKRRCVQVTGFLRSWGLWERRDRCLPPRRVVT